MNCAIVHGLSGSICGRCLARIIVKRLSNWRACYFAHRPGIIGVAVAEEHG